MEIYHHYVANPREPLLLFPKIVTGHCIGLPAIPEDRHSGFAANTASAGAEDQYLPNEK